MSILVDKLLTKNRWEDGFKWKQPNEQEKAFLESLKNIQRLSCNREMLEKNCKEYATLLKEYKAILARIEQKSNTLEVLPQIQRANEIKEKIAHVERIIGRKIAVSIAKNFPELLEFDLQSLDPYTKNYQEALAHKNNHNLPFDYYGIFNKLINSKFGVGSEFHKRAGVDIDIALDYGDIMLSFNEEEIDAVISYTENPRSSSLSEESNKYYDTYYDGVSREEIMAHATTPNIDWLLAKKNSAKGKEIAGSTPSEMGAE